MQALQNFGIPFGMAEVVEEQDRCVGFRIFILDNSGSTDMHDGTSYAVDHTGNVRPRTCTRWEEIKVRGYPPIPPTCSGGNQGARLSAHSAHLLVQRSPCGFAHRRVWTADMRTMGGGTRHARRTRPCSRRS
jgi:hypothetical protein